MTNPVLQLSLSLIVSTMKRDKTGAGAVHVGRDGVLRTLNGARDQVLDYVQLTPRQFEKFTHGGTTEARSPVARVDGRDIADAQSLFAVPAGIAKRDLNPSGQSRARKSPLLSKRACDSYACQDDDDCYEFGCDFCAIQETPGLSDRCANN